MEVSDQGASVDSEQVQQDDPEPDTQSKSNQETQGPENGSTSQGTIDFRIQQLQNRRFILLSIQNLRKREGTTEETTGRDSNRMCELEAIQKELDELMAEKEKKMGKLSKPYSGQKNVHPALCKTQTPHGGVYLLPPLQDNMTLEETVKTTPAAGEPTGPVAPGIPSVSHEQADSLHQVPAFTKCPSCQEVVFTETHSTVSEAMWMMCCLCSSMGLVAGCCLIPFFIDRLRNVQHRCPKCQAHVHTHRPF